MKCRYCGKKIRGERRIYCNDFCRNSYQLKTTSLADLLREAEACNLDYGSYRGLRALGKSFDELKAQADFRRIPAHAHGRTKHYDH